MTPVTAATTISVLAADQSTVPVPVGQGGGAPEPFIAEIRQAGGTVAPLSSDTGGLIWLPYADPDQLGRILDAYPNVRWIQLPWAGVDLFAETIRTHQNSGRVWTSAKGAYSELVAEHTLMLMLALLRDLPRRITVGHWEAPSGVSLYGLKVLIIGAGGIAVKLVEILQPFRVDISILRRQVNAPLAGARVFSDPAALAHLLPQADIVILAAALTAQTHHLINTDALAKMKAGAILINVGRGPLVDTSALVSALQEGQLGGAGLDVTEPEPLPADHPLWKLERCIVTPHSSNTTAMKTPRLMTRIRENTAAYLGKTSFSGVVDPVFGY